MTTLAPCGTEGCLECTPWGLVAGALAEEPKNAGEVVTLFSDYWAAAAINRVLERLVAVGIVARRVDGDCALTPAAQRAYASSPDAFFVHVEALFAPPSRS